jgi:hypothetical protein
MNERIQKLAEQCYDPEYGFIIPEKFAELIVRECEKVAKGGSWYYDAPSCGWRNPINHVCNEMKQHFGVEDV